MFLHSSSEIVYIIIFAYFHGLPKPNKAFFQWYPKFLGLCKQIGLINLGVVFGIFGQTISTILAPWVSCPWEDEFGCFSYNNLVSWPERPNGPKLKIHVGNLAAEAQRSLLALLWQELAGGFVKNGYNDGHFGNRGKHDSNLEIIHAHNCYAMP